MILQSIQIHSKPYFFVHLTYDVPCRYVTLQKYDIILLK